MRLRSGSSQTADENQGNFAWKSHPAREVRNLLAFAEIDCLMRKVAHVAGWFWRRASPFSQRDLHHELSIILGMRREFEPGLCSGDLFLRFITKTSVSQFLT